MFPSIPSILKYSISRILPFSIIYHFSLLYQPEKWLFFINFSPFLPLMKME